MKKKMLMVITVFFLIGIAAVVAEQKIPYVDIPTAQAKVEELTQENQTMAAEAEEMQQETKELQQEIENWKKDISEMELILDKVVQKGKELYEVYGNIVDAETKEKAHNAIETNKDLRSKLEKRIKAAQINIQKAQKTIDNNEKNTNINNNKISRNKDRINLLNASIEKTQNQTQVLSTLIDNINETQNEAASFLESTE